MKLFGQALKVIEALPQDRKPPLWMLSSIEFDVLCQSTTDPGFRVLSAVAFARGATACPHSFTALYRWLTCVGLNPIYCV